jgi:sugar lactone lactonase YvrE
MKTGRRGFVLAMVVFISASAQGQNSPTYVWRNFVGYPGSPGTNDDLGNAARFNRPASLALDSAGNAYVADMHNHTIRKVATNGLVTTLAGLAGSTGTNDGIGSTARFYLPGDVTVDHAGTVYVADTYNHTIRKVTSDGVVTTLAGNPSITNQYGEPVGGYADGPGAAARFNLPAAVAVDSGGSLYVVDCANNLIRKVTPTGTNWVVTTLAGSAGQSGSADGTNGVARFSIPEDVAVDEGGNLYVADANYAIIRKVAPVGTNWVVTTLAGSPGLRGSVDATNSAARFARPYGVALDSAGNLYVPDKDSCTIRKVSPVGTNWVVTTIGGQAGSFGSADGTGTAAQFYAPYGLAVDYAGRVYVADTGNSRISKGIPLPALAIRRSGTAVVISWPSMSTGFVLQQGSDPADANSWQDCGRSISDDGTNKSVSVQLPAGDLFFRMAGN